MPQARHPSGGSGATKLSRDFRGGGRSLEGGSTSARIQSVSRKTTFSLIVPILKPPIYILIKAKTDTSDLVNTGPSG
jgi:hypothetical protein